MAGAKMTLSDSIRDILKPQRPPIIGTKLSPVCLKFDGTNDYINCGNNPSLEIVEGITLTVTIEPDTLVGDKGIISKRNANVSSPYLFALTGDRLRYTYYGIDEAWHSTAFSNAGITTDNQQAGVTFEPSTGLVQFYRDGLKFGDKTYTSSPKPNDLPVLIGYDPGYTHFGGSLDDVRIYNRALSESEIKQLYRGIIPLPGMVAEWAMDQGEGNKLWDSSKNNNHGTIHGCEWE